jgi:hypothetical protein
VTCASFFNSATKAGKSYVAGPGDRQMALPLGMCSRS